MFTCLCEKVTFVLTQAAVVLHNLTYLEWYRCVQCDARTGKGVRVHVMVGTAGFTLLIMLTGLINKLYFTVTLSQNTDAQAVIFNLIRLPTLSSSQDIRVYTVNEHLSKSPFIVLHVCSV